MKKKVKIAVAATAFGIIFSLTVVPQTYTPENTTASDICALSASVQADKDNIPPAEIKAPVPVETWEISTHSTPQTEIRSESSESTDSTQLVAENDTRRNNPNYVPSSAPSPQPQVPAEPKMGDTRVVNGQKQVYFLGFGWIEDCDELNVGTYVDGDGDINKMVGIMD